MQRELTISHKRHLGDKADTAINEEMETAIREWLRIQQPYFNRDEILRPVPT